MLLVRGRATVNDPVPIAEGAVGAPSPAVLGVPSEVVERAAAAMQSQKRCVIRVVPDEATFIDALRLERRD